MMIVGFFQECVEFIQPVLGHAIDLLQDNKGKISATHTIIQGHKVSHTTCTVNPVI